MEHLQDRTSNFAAWGTVHNAACTAQLWFVLLKIRLRNAWTCWSAHLLWRLTFTSVRGLDAMLSCWCARATSLLRRAVDLPPTCPIHLFFFNLDDWLTDGLTGQHASPLKDRAGQRNTTTPAHTTRHTPSQLTTSPASTWTMLNMVLVKTKNGLGGLN
jgi:hypothetical protein